MPNAKACLSSGQPIPGCVIRIVDEDRKDVKDGEVGEIAIKSVSLFCGYRNYPDKTREVLEGGWYYSGDYGFQYEDELYVIGRKKDLIIIAGQNVYPEDVEDVVGKVNGVIPGRVIAFAEDDPQLGSEQIAVIAETESLSADEKKALELEIMKAGMEADMSIRKIYLVSPRWLIKSSAGKPSRKANVERIRCVQTKVPEAK